VLSRAHDELKGSLPALEKIMEMILAIGNYMNDCTKFGDAVGIKLSSLLSLPTMKATSKASNNLLHFLAQMLTKQSPELLKFTDGYVTLWGAPELSFSQILNDIMVIEKHVLRLTEDLQRIKDGKDGSVLSSSSSSTSLASSNGHQSVGGTPERASLARTMSQKDGFYLNPLYKRIQTFLSDAKPKLTEVRSF
jgi:hypothetical protein